MTLEQLKERIEATCNKNGFFPHSISFEINYKGEINAEIDMQTIFFEATIIETMPNTDLLLEAVDLECRAIKARQSSASNGIDE